MDLLIYLSYLFFISEFILMLSKRSKKKSSAKQGDKGSLILLWISIPLTLTAGFMAAGFKIWDIQNNIIYITGIIIFLFGLILRWLSIFQLKKAFTVDVAVSKEHNLKTDGLYKNIRHPSYTGLLLILAGLSIAMCNVISILVITIPFFAAINYRIYVEEKLLTGEFGETYEKYKAVTKKLIKWIY